MSEINEDIELMKKEYNYPEPDDIDLQYKLYKKREFYYHKMKERPSLDKDNYKEIKEFRDNICDRDVTLFDHQSLLSNFINPDTPYKGLLLFHNVGTGKTCSGIAIAEKFKPLVQKYNTKIYVLVNGPLIKENWKQHLIKCTGETYIKYTDKTILENNEEKERQIKNGINQASQFYRFMSFRSFYKRVLGEKILERTAISGDKVKVAYKKTEEGEFERDLADERIHSLNNTLLIVDEAHNLTKNNFGEALKKIIKNSVNLKIVLLTATPMKNMADDIIELLNFIRPIDSPILREKVFNNPDKNYELKFKEGGLEYLKNMARGYVSHIRGADPLTYAKRIDKGVIPPGLLFTKVIRCKMLEFQQKLYDYALQSADDSLDRKSEAVANFSFPGLTLDKKNITGYFGRDGIEVLKNQIKSNYDILNKKLGNILLNTDNYSNLLYLSDTSKKITGKIYHIDYLKYFSIKFYKCLKKLNRLVWGKKGPKTAFIYSNLVKVGIDIFEEILLQNGYLKYEEDFNNYIINKNTICYFCGKTYDEHSKLQFDDTININDYIQYGGKKLDDSDENTDIDSDIDSDIDEDIDEDINENLDENNKIKKSNLNKKNKFIYNSKLKLNKTISESSSDYEVLKKTNKIPKHEFKPATFISVTGKSPDDIDELIAEEQSDILKKVFNNIENKNGKNIKFVLGSKVMNEGISLANVSEVHILDVHFNLGRVDQVVGRGIRYCSHYKLMSELYKFPYVNVYKYAVQTNNDKELSTEEDLYRKSELKYLLIKQVERALKEVAIDCPLNQNGNMFKEEIEEFKDCGPNKKKPCPSICDYTNCEYKCDDFKLNTEFYDPNRKMYRKLANNEIDKSTFTSSLARSEIEFSKKKIKELYIKKVYYNIEEILKYVRKNYDQDKIDLFDDFFVFKALDELIPFTENDFNNFKDTVFDKFNRPGYLIYINKYYIYQPFNYNENITIENRISFDTPNLNKLSLYNYLKNSDKYENIKDKLNKNQFTDDNETLLVEKSNYDFDTVMEYYDSRNEFKYVGILDKELTKRKSKTSYDSKDVFKIREKRNKILDKKRATGIFTFLGGVCTSKEKPFLYKVAKELNIAIEKKDRRGSLCEKIKNKLFELEKYNRGKNKLTYFIIPANHNEFKFPLNIEDRKDYIVNKLNKEMKNKFNLDIKDNKTSFELNIINKITDNYDIKLIESLDFKLDKNNKFYLNIN